MCRIQSTYIALDTETVGSWAEIYSSIVYNEMRSFVEDSSKLLLDESFDLLGYDLLSKDTRRTRREVRNREWFISKESFEDFRRLSAYGDSEVVLGLGFMLHVIWRQELSNVPSTPMHDTLQLGRHTSRVPRRLVRPTREPLSEEGERTDVSATVVLQPSIISCMRRST